jgi:hypothetical protein
MQTKKMLKFVGVVLWVLSLWLGMVVMAQDAPPTLGDDDFGRWGFYDHDNTIRFRLPAVWQVVAQEAGYTLYESEDRSVRMDFSSTVLNEDITLLILLEEVANTFTGEYELEDASIIDTYLGLVGRIEVRANINGQRLRLLQYLLLDGRDFTLVQALSQDTSPEVNERRVTLFDLVIGSASYLRDDAPTTTWRTYTNADDMVTMSAPADWDVVVGDANNLTLALRELGVTINVNYQPLNIPRESVFDMTGVLLAIYETQDLPVPSLEPVRLPVGDALLARIPAYDVTRNDGTVVTLTQYQYTVIQGRLLFFITLGAQEDIFPDALPLLRRIIATLEIIGDTSFIDA